jgi:hypothetical protein
MNHIRPYKFFTLLESPISERMARVPIPSRRGLGGISLLETFLLVAGIRITSAKRIFEFGTFLGNTTLNLAENSPDDAKIFTLDLDHGSVEGLRQDDCDAPLTQIHLAAPDLDFAKSPAKHKINMLYGNSQQFDCSPWSSSIDLVFVDGGHDVPTASADTKNAVLMAKKDKPSCIFWHDYGNRDCEALTKWLDGLSENMEIFHIQDTMLCVSFQGPHDHISQHLLATDPS